MVVLKLVISAHVLIMFSTIRQVLFDGLFNRLLIDSLHFANCSIMSQEELRFVLYWPSTGAQQHIIVVLF